MEQLKWEETFYVLTIYFYYHFSYLVFLRNGKEQDRMYLSIKNITVVFQGLWILKYIQFRKLFTNGFFKIIYIKNVYI